MTDLKLPSYLEQSDEVKDRFKRMKKRPVTLQVKNLQKEFISSHGKIIALNDINFETYKREFVCVIGPSGCGKSTLIRILAGLESPTSGEVLLDGEKVNGPGPDRGMVFQGYTLFPWLTVKKNVMFGLEMAGNAKSVSDEQALQWIDLVGLSKFANAYPHQLSGGMKQRVAIARALANQPRILLMDEPFGALDALTRAHLQDSLMEIHADLGNTVIMITHDVDEAVLLSDRIVMMTNGPSATIGELLDVKLERPRNRIELADNPEYNHYRHEVLTFLYEKQRKVESVSEHRKQQKANGVDKAKSHKTDAA